MNDTIPVFILGSGRSGTFQMVKLLETLPGIEAHHEYLFEHILKPAVLHRMHVVSKADILKVLEQTHVPALHYSTARIWVDSSNALPWIVGPLLERFPNARFVHLLRDGRKVASSFYNKFTEVMYDDHCVSVVRQWLGNRSGVVEPSPEKKYWRPFPVQGDQYFASFDHFNRFQRLCYYWRDANLRIKDGLDKVPEAQKLTVHLEDVVSDAASLEKFLRMFNVRFDDRHLQFLKRPVNVAVPQNFPLTEQQRTEFAGIAGDAMELFGYTDAEEYDVTY